MSDENLNLPVPRLFVRDLLSQMKIRSGSKILDVGCGSGTLTSVCQELGVQAVGYDTDADKIDDAQSLHPEILFQAGTLANSIPFSAGEFDLAFVRGIDAYNADLQTIEAYASSANLLSCLKPLGKLVFLYDDAIASISESSNERQQELAEHFSQFPGRCRSTRIAEGLGRFLSPLFLIGQRARRGHTLFTVQVPPKPIDRLHWHGFARDAVQKMMTRQTITSRAA